MLHANSLEYYGLEKKKSSEIADKIVEFCQFFSSEEDYRTRYQPGVRWISEETLHKMKECLAPGGRIHYEYYEFDYVITLNALRFILFWHDEESPDSLRDKLIEDLSKVQH